MPTPTAVAAAQLLRKLADKIETEELVVTRFLTQILANEDPYTSTPTERLEIEVAKAQKSGC